MYKIDFGFGAFKQTKYFTSYADAVKYCSYFNWKTSRITPVH